MDASDLPLKKFDLYSATDARQTGPHCHGGLPTAARNGHARPHSCARRVHTCTICCRRRPSTGGRATVAPWHGALCFVLTIRGQVHRSDCQ
jgi:hypothetical protein